MYDQIGWRVNGSYAYECLSGVSVSCGKARGVIWILLGTGPASWCPRVPCVDYISRQFFPACWFNITVSGTYGGGARSSGRVK